MVERLGVFARRHTGLWRRVAVHGLWLNGLWEVAQCLSFYDMSRVPALAGLVWMGGATLVDVALCELLLAATMALFRRDVMWLSTGALLFLFLAGALTAISIEVVAQSLGWWRYAPTMPRLRLWNWNIGVLPLLQMMVLPTLAAALPLPRNWKS
jgi:hypothetical protein